jgi:aminoglycoside phosphotransferase (APT) family kinase protein
MVTRPAVDDEIERVREGLAAFATREAGARVSVTRIARLPGGTMRTPWAVDVEIAGGAEVGARRFVYLAERPSRIAEQRATRRAEFATLRALHRAGVRVPRPYWFVDEGDAVGLAPGLIMARVDGETVGQRIVRAPELAGARVRLAEQMGEELARIHAVAVEGLDPAVRPERGQSPAEARLGLIERSLDAIDDPRPALELGLRWLRAHDPGPERAATVHGDYRLGNVVVDPAAGLVAVLDWELTHAGHPGEDLGWAVMRFWRGFDRPGFRGIGPREHFADGYARVAGWRPDAAAARYWEIFASVRWAIITLQQARRYLAAGERDIELASIGRRCAEVEWDLLRLLEEA